MRFLLDENADLRLADHLRAAGHDVTSIVHDYPRSIDDPDVLAIARAERRILITNDRDFGELVISQKLPHAGVIYFRLRATALATKVERLDNVLAHYGDQLDQFLRVTDSSLRVVRF